MISILTPDEYWIRAEDGPAFEKLIILIALQTVMLSLLARLILKDSNNDILLSAYDATNRVHL